MKSNHRIQSCVICGIISLFAVPAAHAQLLDDPLQGSTIGTREGGTFVVGGWQVTNQYDTIYWHIPMVAHGAFDFDVTGIGDACPGGAGSKNELSHMYDYTFGSADTVYSPGYRDNPYKHFIRKQCDAGKERTLEIVWAIPPSGNFIETDTSALTWNASTVYHWRTEWENTGSNAIIRIYRNGILVFTYSLPGSWNPAGFSVRIAASPRRADEGAQVGAIYSNVKVWDLTCGVPAAPTVTAPANGETINTTVAFVQWTGDLHTQYQVRVNTANDPNGAIAYDSQVVNSNLSYAWTGTLSNTTTYYVFVRVGCGASLGPWSAAGRTFTVNTAFVPSGPNIVRVKGTTLCDNNGPFLGVGATYMRAMQRCKYDRTRFNSDCALLASKGFNYFRALSMVDWDTLEIAPLNMTNFAGHFVAAWPDYWQQYRDCIDIAYSYGLRVEVTVFAGAQYCMPNKTDRFTHLDNILSNLTGREHKVVLIEVANENYANGVSDADVKEFAQYLAARTSIPVALTSPGDTSDAGITAMYLGSAADIATVHFSRDTGTIEGGWLPVHDCYRAAHLPGVAPVSSNEPIGAGSSVSTETDPLKLGSAGFFAYLANLPMYVYHSRAGVFGWTGCCPPSGTEVPFEATAGIDAYKFIRTLLPPDVSSWVRNDGLESASPFTNFCNGQANKYWPDVSGATSGCDRNIGAIKGGEFVSFPMGILSNGLTLTARRPMQFTAYNPLTGTVAYSLSKNAGDQFTLAQGSGAYVIVGILTDVSAPLTEVSIDLNNPDVGVCMTHIQGGDGDTSPITIGGRSCRQNVNPAEDFYFYFDICDAWAFQGNKPDVYIIMDYYDSGTGTITLNYDSSTGTGIPAYYRVGGSVNLTNSNTWKSATFHVTDAYFGNRENGGADFRFGDVGNTFYLDKVRVTTQAPTPPIIVPPVIDACTYPGIPYTKQLTLTQGSPAPTWTLLVGPAGATVNANGLVSGWTPSAANFGDVAFTVRASNSEGSDTVSWTVCVLSRLDFDSDRDVDQADFAHVQKCFSGDGFQYDAGCSDADANADGDVDSSDFNTFLPCLLGANITPGC